jgi:glycerol-3-phosphate O-acyltransferase
MAEDATFPLDAFKNQVLHHVVPECIVATAFRAVGGKPGVPVARPSVAAAARALSRVLKLEFIFRPGVTFDELFDEAVKNAVHVGFVVDGVHGYHGTLTLPEAELARGARRFAQSLIGNFVEAYLLCLLDLPSALPQKDDKALVIALLEKLKAHALAGELVCAEAASKAIVENAVALMRELGILVEQRVGDEAQRAEVLELLGRARMKR